MKEEEWRERLNVRLHIKATKQIRKTARAQGKATAAKPEDPMVVPGIHMVERGNQLPRVVL